MSNVFAQCTADMSIPLYTECYLSVFPNNVFQPSYNNISSDAEISNMLQPDWSSDTMWINTYNLQGCL